MPGIGEKTAERLAFHILKISKDEAMQLFNAIKDVKETLKNCKICYNISERDPCEICSSEKRDKTILCIVEEAKDLWAIERTGNFNGLYHVLGGRIAPLDGIAIDDLTIASLVDRIKKGNFREVILATNPTTEGDATAYYIQKQLQTYKVKLTRIAKGISPGTSLEYANIASLNDAFVGRREF